MIFHKGSDGRAAGSWQWSSAVEHLSAESCSLAATPIESGRRTVVCMTYDLAECQKMQNIAKVQLNVPPACLNPESDFSLKPINMPFMVWILIHY